MRLAAEFFVSNFVTGLCKTENVQFYVGLKEENTQNCVEQFISSKKKVKTLAFCSRTFSMVTIY